MRAFFIGNGPSLKPEYLDLLQDEITFGCNNIQLLYPDTDWRPTYYLFTDAYGNPGWEEQLKWHLDQPYPTYTRKALANWAEVKEEDYPRLHIFADCPHIRLEDLDRMAWHLDDGMCIFGGPVNVAAQLCFLKNIPTMYLIGCDIGYEEEKINHFSEEYCAPYDVGMASMQNAQLLAAHAIIKREAKVDVLNCFPNENWVMWPRANFNEILQEKN